MTNLTSKMFLFRGILVVCFVYNFFHLSHFENGNLKVVPLQRKLIVIADFETTHSKELYHAENLSVWPKY